ncbi:P-loop NTPase fold protein [[Clostridium] colinum]|uniref:P-loop NTPase fold protein n=1 Tax=[Clostridium] colinum TaxID=36835 RepID=UPI002024499E|nr:P-loop NTPase fold protein [[Clostridium] colinum]
MSSNSFNTQNTIDVIKDYLDDKIYSYAIMLDGEWGSGKTYFVKNILEKDINKKIIYVSLYGINSLDEISNAIIFSSLKNKNNKVVIASNLGINIGKLLLNNYLPKEVVEIKKELLESLDFKGIFEDNKLKNKFLIFDDLERCKLPLNEVLGYINNYIEHQNVKVMIVANENKIKENFENYTKIKEKLISQTINYIPNLKNSIENILKNSDINEELKNILKQEETIEVCVNMMNKEQHLNLRTYQFFLSKINILYSKIFNNIENINEKDKLIFELIQILLCYSYFV